MKKRFYFHIFMPLVFSCTSAQEKIRNGNEDVNRIDYQLDHEGILKSYYSNGKIESEGQLVDGKKDGIWINYSENGFLNQRSSWINGSEMGDHFEYDKDGEILVHEFYTLAEKNGLIFLRKFDNHGNIIQDEGSSPYWIVFNRSSLKIQDTAQVMIFVSSSKEFSFKYSIQECIDNECKTMVFNKYIVDSAKQLLAKKSDFRKPVRSEKPFFWIIKVDVEDFGKERLISNVDTIWFNK